jgi:hypothetical protein
MDKKKNCLEPLSDEELKKYKPIAEEEIREALKEGREDREKVEKYWRGRNFVKKR